MEAERKAVIARAWEAFAGFARPARLFAHADFEEGGLEEMLAKTRREDLSAEQLGTAAWGPLPLFSPEALAHFAPRIIELALSGAIDPEGEPLYLLLVSSFRQGPEGPRFRLFGPAQQKAVAEAFAFLCRSFAAQLAEEGYLDWAEAGARAWGGE